MEIPRDYRRIHILNLNSYYLNLICEFHNGLVVVFI